MSVPCYRTLGIPDIMTADIVDTGWLGATPKRSVRDRQRTKVSLRGRLMMARGSFDSRVLNI